MYYVVFLKFTMATAILSETSEKLHSCIRTETRNQTQRIKLNILWLVMDQMTDFQAVVAGRSGLTTVVITNGANKIFRRPFKSIHNYFDTLISIQRELIFFAS